jgi:hypothetical protein
MEAQQWKLNNESSTTAAGDAFYVSALPHISSIQSIVIFPTISSISKSPETGRQT